MTAAARDNLVLLVALLSVLVLTVGVTLCVVGWRWLHREEPRPTPKPRAVNRAPKAHTTPAHLPVVYQEVTRLPVLDGDVAEVRDPTRLDLLKHHTERGWRARGERAS